MCVCVCVNIRHWHMRSLLHESNKYKYYINKTTIYKAVRKQRHKMHTFKREKRESVW